MKYIFSLFIVLWSMMAWGQGGGFDPSNPQEPGQMYSLTVNVSPEGAGSVSPSGKNQYALGQKINLSAYASTNYRFVGWKQGEATVSDQSSFSFIIPAEHTALTALFEYQPNNPDEPSPVPLQHKLILNASPSEGGRFNITSGTLFKEGEAINLQAYLNSGYEFEGWKQGEAIVSTGGSYFLTMGTEDISLVGMFRFNPANPGNPGANHWNAETGEVIIDDFVPGNIMSAIDGVIGGSGNRGKVTMVIVSGRMNPYDFGIADYLSNCTLLDLSRTKGCTEIPDYAFDYSNLSSVILPASVERIGYRAFADCKNLTNLSCYAVTPPVVGSYAFQSVNEGIVLHVLSSSISLYSESEGWKNFTILPLTEEVRALEVNLPVGSEGLYKNMTLELVNAETGQKQRYVISDRLSYTFNGLLKNCTYNVYMKTPVGTVLGQIFDVGIEDENKSVTFSSLLALLNVNLKIQTPDGIDVTDQTQITWLDAHQTYLSQGNRLKGQTATTILNYRIVLNQNLGMQYIFPENQAYTVQEKDNQLVYTLIPIRKLTVTGLVKDMNGGALSGAVVSISQKLNKKYSKSFTAQTDTKGKFELQVYDDESTVSVSATDYISQTLTKDNFGEGTELGTIALKSVTGATISLGFTYTTSVIEGEAVNIQSWYSDYANVAYSIYNVTQGKTITEYSVQYPSIVLLEEVSEGDQLRITASSKNNTFVPVESMAIIDAVNRASVTFNVIGLGGINASFISTDNVSVVGILYDSKGELVKKYTYSNVSLSIDNLPDGVYTLVSMANSAFFNSILKLSQLAASGLTEGTDYVQNQITVKSGLIAKIMNDNIPVLDESKLYYTSNNTAFTVNKASIVAGNYLTLKGKIDFKSEYSGAVSDVRMVVDLPESCSFVDNSVMVGSKISGYTLDGNRLAIPLSNYTDQIRFCIIPTEGGTYSPNAFVEFSLGGKTIQQPIGSAYYGVKDLTISVPKTVAKGTLPISGTALGNSAIGIYDNDILIGQTTSLANGVWSATCDLNKPYNLSTHNIYAKVTTKQGLELQSETKEVMYDMNAIQVSTVTMNFYNGWLRNNIEVVFDLLNGTTNASSYMFYTTTDITFIIDFTNNNPDVVSNVTLYVFTDQNEVRPLKATYDEKKDKWIAVSEFGSNNLPINVSVDFLYNAEIALDNRCLSEQYQSFEDLYSDYSASKNLIDSISSKLKDEYREVTLDIERVALLRNLLVSSIGIVEQEPDNEVKEYLLGLSDQEFREYLSDLYLSTDSLFEKTDSLVLDNVLDGSIYDLVESLENGQLLGNIKMSTCESISFDEIIADKNYIPLKVIDGSEIFMKCVSDTCVYIDFTNNLCICIYTDPDDQIVAYAQGKVMQNLRAKLENLKSVLDNMKNVADKVNNYITDLIKKYQNGVMVHLNEREAVHRAALNKMEQGGYVIDKEGYYFHQDRIDEILEEKSKLKNSVNAMTKCQKYFTGASSVFGLISTGYDCYDTASKYWTLYDKIDRKDPCELHPEAPGMIKNDIYYYANTMLVYYIANFSADLIALHGAWTSTVAAVPSGGASLVGTTLCLGKMGLSFFTNQYIQNRNKEEQNRIKSEIENLKCDKGDNDDGSDGNGGNTPPVPTTPPIPPIHDPSGYVYESVESNRLQGVTATCYYKEMVEDMYGDMHENIVLWDAAEYAQKNPLFTDEMGMYAWDVPQGLWQVKFEKEGYQTTYSEWLPVPPPQLEVNIGMVQTTQPTVDAVRGYETGIEVDFSKFMQPATLTTEQVMVTRNGEAVAGEVILLNEEANPMDANQKFVSKVRFIPVEPLVITDKVVLTISRRVKSYAGISMENDYSQEIDIMKEAKSIVASDMEVIYNKTAEITVAVEPVEASVGNKIIVVSASPMIATITPAEATLNEEGKATFTVTGELLGRTMLQFAVEGMNLKSEVKVNVVVAGKEDVSRSYRLSMGWNWLSVNVDDPNLNDVKMLLDPIKESVMTIKGQAGELTNDGQNGLQGSLTILHPEQAYKIKMKQDATLELKGKPVLAASTTVTLNKGWNWIGYVPAEKVSLESALQNLVAEANDVVKGLDSFAVYDGQSWVGSLTNFTPGEGYMYYSQYVKSFNYVTTGAESGTQQPASDKWNYDVHHSENNLIVLAQLYKKNQPVDAGQFLVGAFVGDECRGVAVEKNGRLYLTVHGEQADGPVSLRAFDTTTNQEYFISEKPDWTEALKGTPATPEILHLGELTGITNVTGGWLVYPNPVRDRLYVRGDVEGMQDVRIVNANGQTCLVVDESSFKEGIDVTSLSKGVYFIIMKNGVDRVQQKFIKIE